MKTQNKSFPFDVVRAIANAALQAVCCGMESVRGGKGMSAANDLTNNIAHHQNHMLLT